MDFLIKKMYILEMRNKCSKGILNINIMEVHHGYSVFCSSF